jgi:hypothetical protein
MSGIPDPYLVHLTLSVVRVDLRGITPQGLEAFLKSHDWKAEEPERRLWWGLDGSPTGAFRVWTKGQWEVMVPLRSSHTDYCRRVHEVLLRIAQAMNVTAGQVYFDTLIQHMSDTAKEDDYESPMVGTNGSNQRH